MSPRILVTVSRGWTNWATMRTALEKAYADYPDAVLVHGDCPRGDRDAARIWRSLGGVDEPWPAQWATVGKSAGFVRNAAMVETAPNFCLAFICGSSRGASHCAGLAEDAGISTRRYIQDQEVTFTNCFGPDAPGDEL